MLVFFVFVSLFVFFCKSKHKRSRYYVYLFPIILFIRNFLHEFISLFALLLVFFFFFKFLDVCLKVLRIFGKLRPCHDQVNIMVIICTTSGDMIPMENGLNLITMHLNHGTYFHT